MITRRDVITFFCLSSKTRNTIHTTTLTPTEVKSEESHKGGDLKQVIQQHRYRCIAQPDYS